MKNFRWTDLAVAGALAAVVGVVLPLQTYLGNATIFPFSFGRLVPELLGIFAVFTLGLSLVVLTVGRAGSVIRRARASRAHANGRAREGTSTTDVAASCILSLLTGLLLCVYLESGVLSIGLPELNGGPVPELANKVRAGVDAGIWIALMLAFLIFAKRLRPCLHWISLAVLLLSLAGLVDVASRRPVDAVSQRPVEAERLRVHGTSPLAYESQPTVVANAKYSPTRNILVFVLDSMPGKVTVDVLATNAALLAKFPGFTAYPNNIGMHECTKRGVPGIVTGRHFDPAEISEADYPMTMYETNSFVRAAEAAGWCVAFSPDLLPYGAINLPIEKRVAREERRRSRDKFAFLRQTTEVPFLSLFDTVAFRLSPFFFKGPILYSRIRHAVQGRHSSEGFWGEATLYRELAERPVNADVRPFLGFFHSWGVHPPWSADFATTVTGKFQALARLMDAYRAAGLYDKSLIIATSDHGLDQAPPLRGYPPSASALLLVKPEGATAPFAVSQLPTSHAKIAPLVKSALMKAPDLAVCEKILQEDKPLYRAEIREGGKEHFKDW